VLTVKTNKKLNDHTENDTSVCLICTGSRTKKRIGPIQQEAQLLLEKADSTRVSESQQMILVACEKDYATSY